jgi:hypothetical protein
MRKNVETLDRQSVNIDFELWLVQRTSKLLSPAQQMFRPCGKGSTWPHPNLMHSLNNHSAFSLFASLDLLVKNTSQTLHSSHWSPERLLFEWFFTGTFCTTFFIVIFYKFNKLEEQKRKVPLPHSSVLKMNMPNFVAYDDLRPHFRSIF